MSDLPLYKIDRRADEVLDSETAAKLLGVSERTVAREANAGRIPGKKIGKEWRFSRRALLEWLASHGS